MKWRALIWAAAVALSGCTHSSKPPENSLQVPLTLNLKSLDPAQTPDEDSIIVLPNLFEGLVELAEGPPRVTSDGTVYTFKIKNKIYFNDSEVFPEGKGREVTSADFIYSFHRLNDSRIQSLTAPDDKTFVIQLNQPDADFNLSLGSPRFAVVPHEAMEKYGEDFSAHPVGTGPYLFDSWIRGNKLILLRNPKWHGEAGLPLPHIEKLVFWEFPEAQTRWVNFSKGSVDILELSKESFDKSMNGPQALRAEWVGKGIQLKVSARPETVSLVFNMANPLILKNASLREAIGDALDKKAIAEKFFEQGSEPAKSVYDIENAKRLLQKAGFPGGKGLPPLELATTSSTAARHLADFLVTQLAPLGLKVQVVAQPWPQLQKSLHNQEIPLLLSATSGDSPAIPLVHRPGLVLTHGWVENVKPNDVTKGDYKYLRVNLAKKVELMPKLQ